MKRQYIVILLMCLLFLSSCANNDKGVQKELPATADLPAIKESPLPSKAAADGLSADDLPIDIIYIFDDDEIDWQCSDYQYDQGSFEIPEGWQTIDGEDYGLTNGVFLVPADTDMDDFRFSPNVAVEVIGAAPKGADIPDFSSVSIQKEFFAAQIVSTYSKMGGLSDLEFMVWESDLCYVYITQFKRSIDELSMYQTTYYVMNPDKMVAVNAAYFGEDTIPGVNKVARHLINTFA